VASYNPSLLFWTLDKTHYNVHFILWRWWKHFVGYGLKKARAFCFGEKDAAGHFMYKMHFLLYYVCRDKS
jgi:hypothetical protein